MCFTILFLQSSILTNKKYFPGLPHFYSCWVTELYVFICLERTLSIYCRNFHQKCLAWQSRWQVRYHFTLENFWKGNATLSSVFKTRFSKYWAVSSIFDFLSSHKGLLSLLRDENFFLNRSIGVSNLSFYTSLKNVHLTIVKSALKK